MSVVSLTLGVLSILIPLIGLVLGVIGIVVSRIAIKQIAISSEGGNGLAISVLICGIVGIVVQLFVVFSYIAFMTLATVG